MQGWGHAVVDFTSLEGAVPELDRLGAEGWEAAGLVSTCQLGGPRRHGDIPGQPAHW